MEHIFSFYCPSSSDMPDDYYYYGFSPYRGSYADARMCAARVTEVKRCGGLSAYDVMHGDWTWVSRGTYPTSAGGWNCKPRANESRSLAVQGNYSYRCVPAATVRLYASTVPATNVSSDPGEARILYTKPDRVVKTGEPMFKTQKQLGGRAIASDAMAKPTEYDAGAYMLNKPGLGWFAHKDGYNALYGDAHVAWCGEPDGRFTWRPQFDASNYNRSGREAALVSDYSQSVDSAKAGYALAASDSSRRVREYGTVHVWHWLDERADIDVGYETNSAAWPCVGWE